MTLKHSTCAGGENPLSEGLLCFTVQFCFGCLVEQELHWTSALAALNGDGDVRDLLLSGNHAVHRVRHLPILSGSLAIPAS
jgi:hypothetical protein